MRGNNDNNGLMIERRKEYGSEYWVGLISK